MQSRQDRKHRGGIIVHIGDFVVVSERLIRLLKIDLFVAEGLKRIDAAGFECGEQASEAGNEG